MCGRWVCPLEAGELRELAEAVTALAAVWLSDLGFGEVEGMGDEQG